MILSSITINTLAGSIAALLGLSILLFFYATSLKEVILTEDYLILKKHLNPIHIPYKKILSVKKLKYANLTMTSGSKGFFGFIGTTMDNSVSLVKNRKQMIRINTAEKNYIISCEQPEIVMAEILKRLKQIT